MKIAAKRKLLFWGIIIISITLLTELLARAYYYGKPATHPIAIIELFQRGKVFIHNNFFDDSKAKRNRENNNNHYLVRPQLSKAENDQIAMENSRSNYAIYQPWVEFTFGDLSGKYVNAHNGVRKSVPDMSDSSAQHPLTIFFLGGSTMFGYNVTDEETIPSCFVRAYRKKFPEGKPVKVVNYGIPYYYSYHELIQLADNFFRNKIPGMVIMLDGLNECMQPYASFTRNPFNTPGLQQLINPELHHYPKGFSYYNFPSVGRDSVYKTIVENYFENIGNAKKLAEQFNVKLFCFWQPVPYYNYPNQGNDPICVKNSLPQFNFIYPLVAKKSSQLNYMLYLGDMLQHQSGLPFIDNVHYSPAMNDSIAHKILESVVF